jgi:hypothetical protein
MSWKKSIVALFRSSRSVDMPIASKVLRFYQRAFQFASDYRLPSCRGCRFPSVEFAALLGARRRGPLRGRRGMGRRRHVGSARSRGGPGYGLWASCVVPALYELWSGRISPQDEAVGAAARSEGAFLVVDDGLGGWHLFRLGLIADGGWS